MADTGKRAPLAPQTETNSMSDSQAAETRMRRALGLGTGSGQAAPQQRPEQARARHRFVQDGGVPVVMMGQRVEPETAALRERIAGLEAQLEAERASHASTRRALESEHHATTALQTRLAHNDLAHKDALEQERRMRVAAQEALQEALAAGQARRPRPTAVVAPEVAPAGPDVSFSAPEIAAAAPEIAETIREDDEPSFLKELPASPASVPLVKRGRGRPRTAAPPEPKPVRWWTPSYRAKKT
jgi:hypothetical protein